jgi:hypothetical protein
MGAFGSGSHIAKPWCRKNLFAPLLSCGCHNLSCDVKKLRHKLWRRPTSGVASYGHQPNASYISLHNTLFSAFEAKSNSVGGTNLSSTLHYPFVKKQRLISSCTNLYLIDPSSQKLKQQHRFCTLSSRSINYRQMCNLTLARKDDDI